MITMKKIKKNNFNITSLMMLIVMLAIPVLTMAQGDPGGDPDAPIDGGLSVLLAAGAAYGVKKYRNHKKKNNEDEVSDLK